MWNYQCADLFGDIFWSLRGWELPERYNSLHGPSENVTSVGKHSNVSGGRHFQLFGSYIKTLLLHIRPLHEINEVANWSQRRVNKSSRYYGWCWDIRGRPPGCHSTIYGHTGMGCHYIISSLLTKLLKVCVLLQDLKSEQTRHFPGLKEKAVPCLFALLWDWLPVVAVAIFKHDVTVSLMIFITQ